MSNSQHGVVAELLKEGLAKGAMPFLTVTSNSMSPLLRQGDEIGLRAVQIPELRKGDILVLRETERFTTHRFWGTFQRKGHTMLVTRGDRILQFDRPWRDQQLMGRVAVRRRRQKLLWLDRGLGRRLNHWLARLSQWETHLLSACASEKHPAEGVRTFASSRPGPITAAPLRRLMRIAIHGGSWILAQTASLLPARQLQE